MTLKDNLVEIIKTHGDVTFASLIHNLEKHHFEGEETIYLSDPTNNLILWPNVSLELAQAITELLDEKTIKAEATSYIVYLIDGCHLRIPIAGKQKSYKKPRWVPVVFTLA